MKILITGGTGFLGSSLALRHRERGDDVVVVAKEATPLEAANAQELRGRGVDVRVGEFGDDALVAAALPGVERVYHIAAAMREANVGDERFFEVNVKQTERLLARCRDAGVGRFVYCSTAGVVGTDRGVTTDEETDFRPKDIYQKTKGIAERAVLEFGRAHGYPVTAIRPPGVMGPRDGRLVKLFRMVAKGRVLLAGDGKGKHHNVYVDDLMDAFELAATKSEAVGRVFNASGDESVPLSEFILAIAKALGTSVRFVRVPLAPLGAAAVLCEAACRPFGIQPPLYPRRLDFYRHDEDFSNRRAREVLGWRPRHTLAQGLAETAAGYRERGLLA
ncbi:MAG: NAD(P)-dependent oxidoreductase [bacterium]